MKKIEIARYYSIGGLLQMISREGERDDSNDAIPEDDRKYLAGRLTEVNLLLEEVGLQVAVAVSEQAKNKLLNSELHQLKYGDLKHLIDPIIISTRQQLSEIFVGYIPPEQAKYWEKPKPFGEAVELRFPSASVEISSAYNCYAVGEYTATVFHLMRATELSFRVLAKQSRFTFKKRTLEYTDWQDLANALGKKADALDKGRRGKAREVALSFYRGAVADCLYFKDAYRHPLMHSRSIHAGPETLVAMARVCEFMQRLATKCDEKSTKPLTWGL